MAEAPERGYIPPPDYYLAYTDAAVSDGGAPSPPNIPIGEYSSFGVKYDTSDPAAMPWQARLDAEIEPVFSRLETNVEDHRALLKKLSRSILANYMALIDTLTTEPELFRDNFYALATLFNNMHMAVNEYRPHQAMATIRAMLENQLDQRESTEQALHRYYETIDAAVQRCTTEILPRAKEHYEQYLMFEQEVHAALDRKPHSSQNVDQDDEQQAARCFAEWEAQHTDAEWAEILYNELGQHSMDET